MHDIIPYFTTKVYVERFIAICHSFFFQVENGTLELFYSPMSLMQYLTIFLVGKYKEKLK